MSRALKVLVLIVVLVGVYVVSRHVVASHAVTTTSSTTTSTSATTTSPTSTTSLAGAACRAQDFTGAYVEGEGAVGTTYASVSVTKTTAGACTLRGWPLLTIQDHLGAVLPGTAVDVPSSTSGFRFLNARANAVPTTLTLTLGETAQFALAYSSVQTGAAACEVATTLSVQFVADGASVTVTPQYPLQPCDQGKIWLSPFY